MHKLHQDLQELFFYDHEKLVYERSPSSSLITKSKWSEFRYILEKQYGKPFNFTHYILNDSDGLDQISQEGTDKCICTHPIYNLYYLTHIETQMTFKVGSHCIHRIDEKFDEAVRDVAKERRNRKNKNICVYCDETLKDMRKKYQKDFYCNLACSMKFNHKISFGKHKDKNLLEFICTKEGNKYINWIKNIIKNDSEQFKQYVLFLEIIYENEIEL